jgi:membrane peptidoglycan carboxypeptidase
MEYFAEFNHNFLHYLAILKDRDLKALNPEDPLSPTALSDEEVYPNLNLSDIRRLNGMMGIPREDVDYSKAEELFYWPDFRRSVAMAAFAKFAGKIGIHGKLREVQSMPLGVNEIPLAEMTTAYQTLLTGNIYKCADGEWNEPCLVKEIRDRDGRRIFENSVETKKVLSDTVTEQMAVMLHAVFQYGTAISQYKNLTMTSPSGENTLLYPTFGKTGTTNDYRNVAFLGAIPTFVPNKNGFALDSVIAIGSYVGFDDNRPLKSGRTRIAGSSGGLPQWAEFAKAVVKVRGENLKVDFLDISMLAKGEIPLRLGTERGEVQVNPVTGLPVYSATETVRNVPLLDVPGYTSPAQVETAAASAANSGMMTSLSMPAFAPDALPSHESSSSKAEEEEFELPADFTGDNAFVPIEPGEF